MKTLLYTLFLLLIFSQLHAQSPMGFNFQGVARDASGVPFSEKAVKIKADLSNDNWKYSETHDVLTDKFGLFSITVGEGKVVSGSFGLSEWLTEAPVSLSVSIDITGNGNYTIVGISKFKSVPYAKYADKAGNAYWELKPGGILEYNNEVLLNSTLQRTLLRTESPANTQGIFGLTGAGVTIQQNWPAIGFNHYYLGGQKSLSKGYGGYIGVDPANGGMYFRTIPSAVGGSQEVVLEERMFISPKGLIGIGTIAPTATLDVNRGTGQDGTAIFRGTETVSHFNNSTGEDTYIRGGKSTSNVYINDVSKGNVYISGTANSGNIVLGKNTGEVSAKLNVFGSAGRKAIYVESSAEVMNEGGLMITNSGLGSAAIFNSTEGTGLMTKGSEYSIEAFGSAIVHGDIICTGTVSQSSDLRFKEKIQPLSSALSNVLKLKGVNYYFKSSQFPERRFDKNLQIGFIAQDVKAVFPELVAEDKDGYLSVDYAKVTPLLVEAVKEQNALIENQNDQIKIQKVEIEILNKEIEALKKQNTSMLDDLNTIKAQIQMMSDQSKASLK